MAAGGLRRISPKKAKDAGPINVDVVGRNFDDPTKFNQAHRYRTAKDFVMAYLVKELPPVVSIAGHFRLNGSGDFVPFATVERGTIVNEVRITARGTSQVNSPDLAGIDIGGGAAPAGTALDAGVRDFTLQSFDAGIVLNTPKTYTARATDAKGVQSSQPSDKWAVGVKAYYGKGNVEAATITEAWVRANLARHGSFNQHMGEVTVTPGADDYILYLAPVAWGLRVFEFLGSDQTNPESATRLRVRTDAEVANGIPQQDAIEYFVVRSLGKGLGGGSPYTFKLGTIG